MSKPRKANSSKFKQKKFYLHIGLHKTGTTSIQKRLERIPELAKENYYYWSEFRPYSRRNLILPTNPDLDKIKNEIEKKVFSRKIFIT